MILLYEFPAQYEDLGKLVAGSVDGATWITSNDVGSEGDVVPAGAALYVRGWVPNIEIDGPPASVLLCVDGEQMHQARVGVSRPDVARRFENDDLLGCGFEAVVTTGQLCGGEHQIVAYSVDPVRRRYARAAESTSFTLASEWTAFGAENIVGVSCAGSLDEIIDKSRDCTLTPADDTLSVPRGTLLWLRGWFCDPAAEAPFEDAYALIDRERAYAIDYGSPRPDAAASFDSPVNPKIGFEALIPTADLRLGLRRIEFVGAASDGTFRAAPMTLNVFVGHAAGAQRLLEEKAPAFIDDAVRVQRDPGPRSGAPLQLVRGDRLFVRGWAFDGEAAAVAAGVLLVLDGGTPFAALYGLPRSDVADAHRNPKLQRSGFTAELDTSDLTAGLHSVECRVLARDGHGVYGTSQRFNFEVSES